jgi:UDP:flavonoid glycosyltransferase YjiC (YdhE family)
MRVLFTSVPAPSHVDPLLHLGRALADRGHDVTMATGPQLIPKVEKAGIRGVAAGLDWTEPEADRTFPELRDLHGPEWERWWVRNIFFDRAAHPMAADVGALMDSEEFDVVVRMYIEFGGWAAATARGIPQVVFQLGQAWTDEHLPIVNDLLTPVLGRVAPGQEVDTYAGYGDLLLLMHPDAYEPWTPPTPWFRCEPPVSRPVSPTPPRPDVLNGAGDKPVVLVTFGTVFNRTPGVVELAVEAMADVDAEVVVTVGSTRDPAEFGTVPDHVHIRPFVPYADLLPHCDAVLTHGGFGTTMMALRHGLPLVVMPLGSDQPWHAANAERLGHGRNITFSEATAADVTAAVTAVLNDPSYRERARSFSDELDAMPTLDDAAARIEALVADHR